MVDINFDNELNFLFLGEYIGLKIVQTLWLLQKIHSVPMYKNSQIRYMYFYDMLLL